jgi:hypothetical protein
MGRSRSKKTSFAVANRLNKSGVEAVQDPGMTFQQKFLMISKLIK